MCSKSLGAPHRTRYERPRTIFTIQRALLVQEPIDSPTILDALPCKLTPTGSQNDQLQSPTHTTPSRAMAAVYMPQESAYTTSELKLYILSQGDCANYVSSPVPRGYINSDLHLVLCKSSCSLQMSN